MPGAQYQIWQVAQAKQVVSGLTHHYKKQFPGDVTYIFHNRNDTILFMITGVAGPPDGAGQETALIATYRLTDRERTPDQRQAIALLREGTFTRREALSSALNCVIVIRAFHAEYHAMMRSRIQACLFLVCLAPSFAGALVAAGNSTLVTPDTLAGKWEGFAVTPYLHEKSVVRLYIEFSAGPEIPAISKRPTTEEIRAMTPAEQKRSKIAMANANRTAKSTPQPYELFGWFQDSAYSLEGDEVAQSFFKNLKATVRVAPLFYLHPDFAKTDAGARIQTRIDYFAERMAGTATNIAGLNTETGELIFAVKTTWDKKPREQPVNPAKLRLIYDAGAGVIFGEVINTNTELAHKQNPAALQPAYLPVMLWPAGKAPAELMDKLGEEMNLTQTNRNFHVTKEAQSAALLPESETKPTSIAPSSSSANHRSGSIHGVDDGRAASGTTEETSGAVDPAIAKLQAEVERTQIAVEEAQRILETATQRQAETRAARRGTEGEAREVATRVMNEAKDAYNEARSAAVEASNAAREARKALKAVETQIALEAREARRAAKVQAAEAASSRARSEGATHSSATPPPATDQSRPVRLKYPLHDIDTTPERVIAWVNQLGEKVPELLVDGQIDLPRNQWPNVCQNLFSDEDAIEAFGQPITDWSQDDRKMIAESFRRTQHSSATFDDGVLVLPKSVSQDFAALIKYELERYYPRTLARYYTQNHSRDFLSRLSETIADQEVDQLTFLRLDGWNAVVEKHFGYLWPDEYESSLEIVKQQKSQAADDVLLARLEAAIATYGNTATSASALGDWRAYQGALFALSSEAGKAKATDRYNDAIDAILKRQLDPLTDQIGDLDEGLAAVYAGNELYRKARAVTGRAIGRPAYKKFRKELNDRRSKDLERALPDIEERLSELTRLQQVDNFLTRLLAIPGDKRLEAAASIETIANTRRAKIDEETLLARFSERERDLMVEPGRLKVPKQHDPPTAEEIKFARYRELGRPNPADPNSVIISNPLADLFNLDMVYSVFDVDVRAVAPTGDGYWVVYKFKQRFDPRGWSFDDPRGPPNYWKGLMNLMGLKPVYIFDKFELTSSGWRSSTINLDALWGHTSGNYHRVDVIDEEAKDVINGIQSWKMSKEEYELFVAEVNSVTLWVTVYE